MFESVLLDLLFVFSIFCIWLMLIYNAVLISLAFLYAKKCDWTTQILLAETRDYPPVSIVIPAHNEELVIEKTLQSMVGLDYEKSKLEVFAVNDGSTDRTEEIIQSFHAEYPWIHLVNVPKEKARQGKANALNYGLSLAKHDLIAIYDADNSPEPKSLKILVAGLVGDPKIAATVGKVRTINKEKNILTKFINIEFIAHQWTAQAGRWVMHGITMLPGTNFVLRKKVLDEVGGWDTQSLTEDTELSLRILSAGYKIWFLPNAISWEQEPQEWAVWFKQRQRWVQGNYYIIWKYFRYGFKNFKLFINMVYMLFTYYSLIFFVLFSDILFILGFFEMARVNVHGPILLMWFCAFIMFLAQILISLGLERREVTLSNVISIILMYFTYSQMWLVMALKTMWKPQIMKKTTTMAPHWEKTQRF